MKRTRSQLSTLHQPLPIWSLVIAHLDLVDILSLILVEKAMLEHSQAIKSRCLELAKRPMSTREHSLFMLHAYILKQQECIPSEIYNQLDLRVGHSWYYISLGFLQSKDTKRPKTRRPNPNFCDWPCLALLNRPNASWKRWDYRDLTKHMVELALPLGMCKRIVRRFIEYTGLVDNLIENLISFQMPIKLIQFALEVQPIQKRFHSELTDSELGLDLNYLAQIEKIYNPQPFVRRQLYRLAERGRAIKDLYPLLCKGFDLSFFQVYQFGLTEEQLEILLCGQNPTKINMTAVRSAQVANWMIKQPVSNACLAQWATILLTRMVSGSRLIFEISASSRLFILRPFVAVVVELARRSQQTRLPKSDALLVALIRNLTKTERDLLLDRLVNLAKLYDTRYWMAHIYYPEVPPRRFLHYPVQLTDEDWVLKYNSLKLMSNNLIKC